MSVGSTAVPWVVRLRTTIRRLGGVYLVYHGLAAGSIVVLFFVDTRPGYWREPGALPELAVTILIYPLAIPALVMCGGLHNCGGSPRTVLAVPVLILTLVAAGSGIWLAFDLRRRRRRA
jgi:hypothetical protein